MSKGGLAAFALGLAVACGKDGQEGDVIDRSAVSGDRRCEPAHFKGVDRTVLGSVDTLVPLLKRMVATDAARCVAGKMNGGANPETADSECRIADEYGQKLFDELLCLCIPFEVRKAASDALMSEPINFEAQEAVLVDGDGKVMAVIPIQAIPTEKTK